MYVQELALSILVSPSTKIADEPRPIVFVPSTCKGFEAKTAGRNSDARDSHFNGSTSKSVLRTTSTERRAIILIDLCYVTNKRNQNARANRDHVQLNDLMQKLNDVAYGINVSPQTREDFLQEFGCCGYTTEILDYLVQEFGHRGLVEVGAGNGQWARALNDRYKVKNIQQSDDRSWDFVLAYDTMEELPLSPKIYNNKTMPYRDHFYDHVHRCKSHEDVVRNFTSRGRVLLLVYPSPGSWPLETLKAYIDATAGTSDAVNDKVVFVGEGRLGANCNNEFFDYLLNGGWIIEKIMDVKGSPGGKGFERMYVLTKVPSNI